ncbi:unnamed protein product [Haemonchus placei]|uniref:SCP domain-containing protein n=1 Tax=Haemonchus placei TaxID=6290 RepID=A0A0N4WSF5_HAEPC|nr:unnamed protein product [Haemonchus placei]
MIKKDKEKGRTKDPEKALRKAGKRKMIMDEGARNDRCNLRNGMTDEVRDMFLKKHNEYRSQVARGLAKDRLGGTAPTAGKMARMSYDCKIEESMMRWLNQCKWGHSRGENGENMFMSTDTRMKPITAAAMSTEGWFSELETKGVGKENKLTMQVFNRGVGHYTQIIDFHGLYAVDTHQNIQRKKESAVSAKDSASVKSASIYNLV